jgi:hypothetical protein
VTERRRTARADVPSARVVQRPGRWRGVSAAGILLALGAGKDIAINFSLASDLLLVTSASAAALSGPRLWVAAHALARRPAVLHT